MAHARRDRERLKARLARLRGQVDGVGRALDGDRPCGEVLQQVAAIRGALAGLTAQLVEGHVREHVAAARVTPGDRRAAADELMDVLRKYLR